MERAGHNRERDLKLSSLINEILEIQTDQIETSERWGFCEENDKEAHEFYKLQQESLWVPTETNFGDDLTRFNLLTEEQKVPLMNCLVIFQILDGTVIDCICLKFLLMGQTISQKLPYIAQLNGEAIHSQSYDLQLRAIVPDEQERLRLLDRANSEDWIVKYSDFGDRHIVKSNRDLIYQLTAQASLEGLGFIALFAVIFYYRTHSIINDIPGITSSNAFISRDETLHRNYAVVRVKNLLKTYSEEELPEVINNIAEIVKELVDIIEKAVPTILPKNFDDLTQDDLIEYSKFTADTLLEDMGLPKVYNARMSLPYMLMIGGADKGNYYEVSIDSYKRGDTYKETEETEEDW